MTVELCATSYVPDGEIKRVEMPDGRVLAVYHFGGAFFATDDLCTHGDASLSEGEIEDGQIVCPFHLGKFDIRTGAATGAPCSIALKAYKVTVADGKVLLVS